MDKKDLSDKEAEGLKAQLLEVIISGLKKDFSLLERAAIEAREAATHEESKAENKYDTRGLEASYLAGAQAKRATELLDLIKFFEQTKFPVRNKNLEIGAFSLVKLSLDEDQEQFTFIIPRGFGGMIELSGKKIQILTSQSPLGAELMGRSPGELFDFQAARQKRSCEILSVF